MSRRARAAISAAAWMVLLLASPQAARAGGCDAPAEILGTGAPLPATARGLAEGHLRVLVVGSASVLGPGTSGSAAAWPAQFEARLKAARPSVRVELTTRGGRGLTAGDMVPLLEATPPPHLVVWQVGTVEAARGMDPDWLADQLTDGLGRLKERGTDAVLMDQQFSRFLRANSNIDPYQEVIRIAAAGHAIPLYQRYELMRHWAETDRIDLERTPRANRVAVADQLAECVAETLTSLVLDGAAATRSN
jgi:hypothetical protein